MKNATTTLEQFLLDNYQRFVLLDRDGSAAGHAAHAAARLREEYADNAGHPVSDAEIVADLRWCGTLGGQIPQPS